MQEKTLKELQEQVLVGTQRCDRATQMGNKDQSPCPQLESRRRL